ncbi:argininosuccinate synthase domain-containing protein [Sulfobacillus sp. hq2]|uniref:argininosuccinate synthase domain-containing protein n=1 Tax=Sulfobacillus TaxID=28033 RepID=UPI000CD096CD|nr:argininosuccinate synthase domain-containing protein [Sulfobacillus sp. hq2]POB09079.1 protein ArgG [Sulfobacillus sp. hq2]
MSRVFSTFADVDRSVTGAVLLYSGGLDSLYTAQRLRDMDIAVTALTVNVGQSALPSHEEVKSYGLDLIVVDGRERLADEFLAAGIRANARYNGNFPLSSSFTRPLMAQEAVRLATERGHTLIVHSATPYQNTAARVNLSIFSLAPRLDLLCPGFGDYISREAKTQYLADRGIAPPRTLHQTYSIDENLWARVIENDSLEDPAIDIPVESVFAWTRMEEKPPIVVTIAFEQGQPVAVDGVPYPLSQLIDHLNQLLGPYGIGRFVGLEDGVFGVKNPELREAPAAHLILESHALLEEQILAREELRIKRTLDDEWTRHVCLGGWFSPLKQSLDLAIQNLNRPITGEVRWSVSHQGAFCLARRAPDSLHAGAIPTFPDEFQPYTLESFYRSLARQYRIGTVGNE